MQNVLKFLFVSGIGIIIWILFKALWNIDRTTGVSIIVCAILIIYVLWKGIRSTHKNGELNKVNKKIS